MMLFSSLGTSLPPSLFLAGFPTRLRVRTLSRIVLSLFFIAYALKVTTARVG